MALQPDNLTAHYHLGLRARQRRDFEAAARHLEQALAADPNHSGIIKTLGYSYVWLGNFEAARPLLTRIPEAQRELKVYSGWWGQQQRRDLADNALQMATLLAP